MIPTLPRRAGTVSATARGENDEFGVAQQSGVGLRVNRHSRSDEVVDPGLDCAWRAVVVERKAQQNRVGLPISLISSTLRANDRCSARLRFSGGTIRASPVTASKWGIGWAARSRKVIVPPGCAASHRRAARALRRRLVDCSPVIEESTCRRCGMICLSSVML
jgi:hypothetical protein